MWPKPSCKTWSTALTPTPTAASLPQATDLPPEPELTAELLAPATAGCATERPETGEMRLSMLEDVYEVSYYYDADGNMMESVVRAQTGDLINIQWTIYINRYYERQIDYMIDTTTSQVIEVDYYYRKYYYAGNTRIAIRYYEDGVPTQYWLL